MLFLSDEKMPQKVLYASDRDDSLVDLTTQKKYKSYDIKQNLSTMPMLHSLQANHKIPITKAYVKGYKNPIHPVLKQLCSLANLRNTKRQLNFNCGKIQLCQK